MIFNMVQGLLVSLQIFISDVSDGIIRACNMSGATQAVAHDISKALDMIWHTGLILRLDSYGIFYLVLSDQFVLFAICGDDTTFYSLLSINLLLINEKSCYKMLGLFTTLNWIRLLNLSQSQNYLYRKIGPLIHTMKFLSTFLP